MMIAKWGNSLAVRLPKEIVEEMGLKAGDEVAITRTPQGTAELAKLDRRAEFLKRMAAFNYPLPEGYRFDRDEANER